MHRGVGGHLPACRLCLYNLDMNEDRRCKKEKRGLTKAMILIGKWWHGEGGGVSDIDKKCV